MNESADRFRGITPQQFLAVAQAVADRAPDALLVKNEVGNLAVVVDGAYAGYVRLFFADDDDALVLFADQDQDGGQDRDGG